MSLKKYEDFLKIKKCGLFVDAKMPYIAATPDGFANCKCHGLAVLEVKCPYSLCDMEINELTVIKKVDKKKTVSLEITHRYYTQVVSQMALTGANHCYFIVWTQKDLFVERINYDESHNKKIQDSLGIFFKSYICPVLLDLKTPSYCGACEKVLLREHEI